VDSYKKDKNGEVVITQLNEPVLQAIAREGKGEYINGTNTTAVVQQVTDILSQMDKTQIGSQQFADFQDQFQWCVVAAKLLLFFDSFLVERKMVWIQKLNLFNEKKYDK